MEMFRILLDRKDRKKYQNRVQSFAIFFINLHVIMESINKYEVPQSVFVVT